ncbi:MAG TPA: hypothetical protein VK770_02505 [Candidatus Acidoferrum sp.]|nr:hypothetical protein [Candidatus Acidoferrum sp.]
MQPFLSAYSEWNVFFLDAASANGFQPFSQANGIHSRGGANRLEISLVFKKELLCFAAKTQWPADPFFQRLCDDGAPKPFFRRAPILNMQDGTFKH